MKNITIKGEGNNQSEVVKNLFSKIYTSLSSVGVTEATVNVAIGAMFRDISTFSSIIPDGIEKPTYPIGVVGGITISVDPLMKYTDTRVLAEGLEITVDIDPMDIDPMDII